MPPTPRKKDQELPDGWQMRDIAIATTGEATFRYPAMCLRNVAVHKTTNSDRTELGGWSVTALGSKCWVIKHLESKHDAVRIAEFLDREAPEAMEFKDNKVATMAMPVWIRGWVKACRTRKKWVDPTPYRPAPPTAPRRVGVSVQRRVL